MAHMDELEIGDGVTVTDLRQGKNFHGTIVALQPSPDSYSAATHDRVLVRCDHGPLVRVGPGFVTLDKGEAGNG